MPFGDIAYSFKVFVEAVLVHFNYLVIGRRCGPCVGIGTTDRHVNFYAHDPYSDKANIQRPVGSFPLNFPIVRRSQSLLNPVGL